MSLTSFLSDNADVRERFREEFKKPTLPVKKDLIAPPLTKNYSTVGTAFDYLLRFFVQHLNPHTEDKGWVAVSAVGLLRKDAELYAKGKSIISRAKSDLKYFLETGRISDALIESALLLATLDPIFRAHRGHAQIGIIHKDDIQDLRNLISVVNKELFVTNGICKINPTFGSASALVGGADADIILNDVIIDIKTTKDMILNRDDFNQVIGYYLLNYIQNKSNESDLLIGKIGVYFSRYGYMYVVPVSEIIDFETFPDFVAWFAKRANEAFPSRHSPRIALGERRHAFLNVYSNVAEGQIVLAFSDHPEDGYFIVMNQKQGKDAGVALAALVTEARGGMHIGVRTVEAQGETLIFEWNADRGTICLSGDGWGIDDGSGAEMTLEEAKELSWNLRADVRR